MAAIKFGFTAKDIIDEGRVNETDIRQLKKWLTSQDFPNLTDEQIVLFLLSCCNDQKSTTKTIKAFYSTRNGVPELFQKRNTDRLDMQKQLATLEYCILPQRTDDGCAIVFHRLYDTCYSNYEMETSLKLLFMTLDAAIYDHPPEGLVILFDMKGVGLMHLTKVKLGLLKNFFQYLQEALPVRLKNIHVLNSVYFLDKVMAIIKPFAKKEVMELIHFHPPTLDMEEFYEKCLPRKCLPKELGGDLPSVRVFHEQTTQKLASMESYFEAEELQRSSTV